MFTFFAYSLTYFSFRCQVCFSIYFTLLSAINNIEYLIPHTITHTYWIIVGPTFQYLPYGTSYIIPLAQTRRHMGSPTRYLDVPTLPNICPFYSATTTTSFITCLEFKATYGCFREGCRERVEGWSTLTLNFQPELPASLRPDEAAFVSSIKNGSGT